jgi:hypothetical protein
MDQPQAVYPEDLKLETVRQAIVGMSEFKSSTFKEADGTELIFYNYRFCTQATFPSVVDEADPHQRLLYLVRRECRGLCFRVSKEGEAKVAAR